MSGIFGLSAYNDQNLAGLIPDKTRESFREYGYFGGGNNPGLVSTVDRIDYSNDTATASVRGPLGIAKRGGEATGNSNFGYFAGGFPPVISRVDRIDYSNDTATASVRGPLGIAKRSGEATGNSNFGYFAGGFPPVISTVNRIDYSNDTAQTSPRGPLSQAKHTSCASGNSNFGYFTGGHTNNNTTDINFSISTIDRIDYSNDLSTASIRGNLNQNRTTHSIAGNSNYGWIAGGNRAINDPAYFTSVERLDYSNDVSLTSFRSTSNDITGQGGTATGNNNFGYYHRGNFPAGINRTDLQRIDYSNDLVSPTLRGNLTLLVTSRVASGNSNFGYFGGGLLVPAGYSPNSSVERIDYSNDTTTASVRGPLSLERGSTAATSSHSFGGSPISQYGVFPKPFGYFGGGVSAAGAFTSKIDRIDYSNDTQIASTRNSLSSILRSGGATGNSNFGYFGGGVETTVSVSTVNRINYSNDASTVSIRGPLSSARRYSLATGNFNFGYFGGGGAIPVAVSTVDRIDYSNDSATASVRGPLSGIRTRLAATGNSNFGYFGGGSGPVSTVDRINYSNDTATASVRNPLQVAADYPAATGTNNFGYFGAGNAAGTRIQRVDYSNDTTTVVSNLLHSRYGFSATGNFNFGYFDSGFSAYLSTIERLDYSNDAVNAQIRGNLTTSLRERMACSPLTPSSAFSPDQLPLGFSNTDFQPTSTFFDIQSMRRIEDTTNASVKKRALGSYGYFGGGSPGPKSTVDRIDYSNDTSTASVRGPLSSARSRIAATGNLNFGYYAGGATTISTIDRIDYANDLSIASVRGPLTAGRYSHKSATSKNFGYFFGYAGLTTNIDRVNYSNDNVATSIRGYLNTGVQRGTSSYNTNFGYSVGGVSSVGAEKITQRINFSNDNTTTLLRGELPTTKFRAMGTGNEFYGYYAGGLDDGESSGQNRVSRIERLDYSNDLATGVLRTFLTAIGSGGEGVANSLYGYFSISSRIERIDFSNDTATTTIRGPLSAASGYLGATTNARNS